MASVLTDLANESKALQALIKKRGGVDDYIDYINFISLADSKYWDELCEAAELKKFKDKEEKKDKT